MPEEKKAAAPAPADVAADAVAPQKGGLSVMQLVLIVVLSLVSSASGGAISGYLISKKLPQAGEGGGHEANEGGGSKFARLIEKGAVIPLDPFVVNLADKDSPRYLRIKISLLVADKKNIKEIVENQALIQKVRDVILQDLASKRSDELITDEGKNKLRKELMEKLGDYFEEPRLGDVMFTEFVIQL